MTRDEFYNLLDQHGIVFVGEAAWHVAQLVAQYERECCAMVCESMDEPNLQLRYEYKRGALNCADAIRARGKA
jgi:hypothetical protein